MPTPLYTVRKARALSLRQVADQVGSDTGNLSRIENGKQLPSPDLAEKLARLFAPQGLTELQLFYPQRYLDHAASPAIRLPSLDPRELALIQAEIEKSLHGLLALRQWVGEKQAQLADR